MKRKNMLQRIMAVFLAALMVVSGIPSVAFAEGETRNFQKITEASEFTTGQYVMAVDTGFALGKLESGWGTAVSVTPDTVTPPDETVCTITVTGENAKIMLSDGNTIAPKGGNNNGILAGDYDWAWTFADGKFTFSGTGSDTVILASNKSSGSKFRGYKKTTVAGQPGGYPSAFTLYKLTTGGSEIPVEVVAPTATTAAGEVEINTAITLVTTTAGASIYFTTDGTDPDITKAEQLYGDTNKPVITADCTVKAVAVLGETLSAVQSFVYTVKTTAGTMPIADGDKVVIYAPAYNKALSATYNGFYNTGTDVTVDGDKVTGYTEADIWTVIDNKDGTFSFAYNDQKIGMGDSFSSMPLGEKNDKWELEAAADGTWYVKNTVRKAYIEWFASKNNWSGYGTIASGSEGMFQLKFYKTDDIPVTPEGPIKDGDRVVIYAPAYMTALSGSYSGFYNKGTTVKVEDGKLTGYTANDIWTVADNGDGTYSFAFDGQKLAMGDSFSSMPLGEKNDKWVLEKATDDTWYVKNTVRNAFIEWQSEKNTWSAYYKIAEGSEGMFQLTFYPVTEEPTDPEEPSEVTGLEIVASPKSGASVTKDQKITLKAANGVEIYYTMSTDGNAPADPVAGETAQKYTEAITVVETPTAETPIIMKAVAYIPAAADKEAQTGEVVTFTYKAPTSLDDYELYFGQLHAHTNISDGEGSVKEAFEHASKVDNLDFLAVTDHSNWFEGKAGLPAAGTTHMGDENAQAVNSAWKAGHDAAKAITTKDFVGLYGYEMTWSSGPGHMNTFNSLGFENRNVAPYKKGDKTAVLEAYYKTLNENPRTISQFNHPGPTFGDFEDFGLYDEITDNQITLLEVGNGEGPIGGSGYFPSYTYYTRALDKGWHVAPTNNQDNHKGNWGDSNTARSVVLAEELTEDAIYDAMKNYRVYATEDNDLSILYSLNGNAMGSILGDQDDIDIHVTINDPTDTGSTKVEVIVNGGKTLAEQTFSGNSADIDFENLSATYGYYYLRVTQADKNLAVTAPVWVGESVNAGISKTQSDIGLPIKGDELHISSQIFNNLSEDMVVNSLTYTIEGQETPIHVADVKTIGTDGVVAKKTSCEYSFPYTAAQAGGFNINAVMTVTIGGEEYTFTDVLKLTVADPSIASKVLVDGTHFNDYVTGYYAGNMTNFVDMGTKNNMQVRIAQPGETITADTLKDISLLVVSAPLKKAIDDKKPCEFEDEFVAAVRDYVANGGTVIVCGIADYQDGAVPYTTYAQDNKLLEGIGSTLRMNDDEVVDLDENGGNNQTYRLYFNDFNTESKDPAVQEVLKGVKESGLPYSAYSGCSVSVGKGEALVYGHDTTFSINSKNPAQGHDKPIGSTSAYDESKAVVTKGNVVAMATEAVGKGRVFVTGTVFCSSFEIATQEPVSYCNTIIAENILKMSQKELVINTIEEARAGDMGEVFTVIGTVANGTAESGNAFFDTIYIQDDKGNGINVFPINDNSIERGMQVMITGSVSEYQGEKQLSVIKLTVLPDPKKEVVITDVTTKEADDYDANFGKLVKVEGSVQSVKVADNGEVAEIIVQDTSGVSCRVFIDGYIHYSNETSQKLEEFAKEGNVISAMGFVSHDPVGNRLRVRDRSEIKFIRAGEEIPEKPDNPDNGNEHKHAGNGVWVSDTKDHWHVCECGDIIDKSAHTLDKNGECTVCHKILSAPQGGNETVTSPNTGDNTSSLPWIILLGVAAIAIAAVVIRRKKQ